MAGSQLDASVPYAPRVCVNMLLSYKMYRNIPGRDGEPARK